MHLANWLAPWSEVKMATHFLATGWKLRTTVAQNTPNSRSIFSTSLMYPGRLDPSGHLGTKAKAHTHEKKD